MKRSRLLDNAILAVVALAAWQGLYWVSGSLGLSSPAVTASKLAGLLGSGDFWSNVAETMRALAMAAGISAVTGVAIGAALGAHRLSSDAAEPVLISFYSLPKVVLYPLLLQIFGLGISAKVAFGALHGVFPIAIFTMNAVQQINPVYLRAARVMQLTPLVTARTILLPAVLPEILTGLRLSVALSLLGVLIGELFASQRGLGYMLIQAMGFNDIDTITAVAVFLVIIALIANGIMLLIVNMARRGPTPATATQG